MRKHRESKLTTNQLETLIPGGLAAKDLSRHAEVAIEVAELSQTGRIMVARQVITTPIRKLLKQGAISVVEAEAAQLLSFDHDAAFAGGRSILAAAGDRVDGGRDPTSGMDRKLSHADRYRRAMAHLGADLARVAYVAIVEGVSPDLGGIYRGVGAAFLPNGGANEQTGGGKTAIVIACRELAVFYGLMRDRKAA